MQTKRNFEFFRLIFWKIKVPRTKLNVSFGIEFIHQNVCHGSVYIVSCEGRGNAARLPFDVKRIGNILISGTGNNEIDKLNEKRHEK